jgi:hypothetical protein
MERYFFPGICYCWSDIVDCIFVVSLDRLCSTNLGRSFRHLFAVRFYQEKKFWTIVHNDKTKNQKITVSV